MEVGVFYIWWRDHNLSNISSPIGCCLYDLDFITPVLKHYTPEKAATSSKCNRALQHIKMPSPTLVLLGTQLTMWEMGCHYVLI